MVLYRQSYLVPLDAKVFLTVNGEDCVVKKTAAGFQVEVTRDTASKTKGQLIQLL